MHKKYFKIGFWILFLSFLLGATALFINGYGYASTNSAMTNWLLPLPEGNYRITQGDKDDPTTCQQGWSHCSDKKVLKCAIDLAAMKPGEIEGFPLLAPYSGKIWKVGWDIYGGGYYLYIEHDDGLISHYEHLREKILDKGSTIQKGDCVGRVSNTGGDYAPHLHFVVLDSSGQSCVKISGINGNTSFNYSPSPNPTIVRSTNRKIDEISNCPGESPTSPITPSPSLPPPSAQNNPPNRPSNISPYDNQGLHTQTPELCAKENGDPDAGDFVTGYYFQIHDSAQNWDSGWTSSSCVKTSPLGNFVYRWNVKVRDTHGRESEWSDDWIFEVSVGANEPQATNNSPNSPSLFSPYNWQEFQNVTPQLCAIENGDPDNGDYITAYRFEIYESAQNWDSGWVNFSCITPPVLDFNTYKWHSKVKDSKNAESDWSEVWNFTIRDISNIPQVTNEKIDTSSIKPTGQISYLIVVNNSKARIELAQVEDGVKQTIFQQAGMYEYGWLSNGEEMVYGERFMNSVEQPHIIKRNVSTKNQQLFVSPQISHFESRGNWYLYFSNFVNPRNSDFLYFRADGHGPGNYLLWKVDLNSGDHKELFHHKELFDFDVSPAQEIVTIEQTVVDGTRGMFLYSIDGTKKSTIYKSTDGSKYSLNNPSWSPDGEFIVFSYDENFGDYYSPTHLWIINKDSSNLQQITFDNNYSEYDPKWSPDGDWIVFSRKPIIGGNSDIWIVSIDGSNLINLTNTPDTSEEQPSWRPYVIETPSISNCDWEGKIIGNWTRDESPYYLIFDYYNYGFAHISYSPWEVSEGNYYCQEDGDIKIDIGKLKLTAKVELTDETLTLYINGTNEIWVYKRSYDVYR